MKSLKLALAASTSLMWMAPAAHADPFTIGNAILVGIAALPSGAGVALGIFGAVGTAGLGSIVLTAAAIGFNAVTAYLSRPNIPSPDPISTTSQATSGPGRHAFGRVILGAKIDLGRTSGYTLHRLGLMCFGAADGVEEWYVNGVPSIVEVNGDVSSPPFGKPDGSYLNVLFKPGSGTETAWPQLLAAYPEEWTASHRVRGIAQYLAQVNNPGVTDERWGKMFQKGFPEITALVRAGHFFDPRDSSSDWSLNGALITLHYFRQISGYADNQIDFVKCGKAANWCDTVGITLSGGWEGVLDTDKVLNMLECASLQVRTGTDDKVCLEGIADDPAPELRFPWEHVLEWDLQAGPEGVERPNVCRVKYFSPESLYAVEEIPDVPDLPWASVSAEIAKYGERERTVELTFCNDCSQAQRIARRIFWMDRAETLVIKTSLAGIALDRLYCAEIEIDGLGEDGGIGVLKCVVEDLVVNNGDGTCEAVLKVVPDILKVPFNPATDEAAPPPTVAPGTYDAEVDTPDAPDAATVVQYPVSGAYETRVMFDGVAGGTIGEAVYQTYTGLDIDAPLSLDNARIVNGGSGAAARWMAYEAVDLSGEKVRWRVRLFNDAEDGSNLSGELVVDPMATDNGVPDAPVVSSCVWDAGDWTVSYTAPEDISVVAIKSEVALSGGSWSDGEVFDVQPGQSGVDVTFSAVGGIPPYTSLIRFRAVTTDGTLSAASPVYNHYEA